MTLVNMVYTHTWQAAQVAFGLSEQEKRGEQCNGKFIILASLLYETHNVRIKFLLTAPVLCRN